MCFSCSQTLAGFGRGSLPPTRSLPRWRRAWFRMSLGTALAWSTRRSPQGSAASATPALHTANSWHRLVKVTNEEFPIDGWWVLLHTSRRERVRFLTSGAVTAVITSPCVEFLIYGFHEQVRAVGTRARGCALPPERAAEAASLSFAQASQIANRAARLAEDNFQPHIYRNRILNLTRAL